MLSDILNILTSSTVLIGLFAALVVKIIFRFQINQKLPPGPIGLPFVGYLPFLRNKPYEKLLELNKKYGSVYSLRLGGKLVVIICDYPTMKSVYNQDVSMGRAPDSFFEFQQETKDVGAIHGIGWKDQRKYALHLLRELGLGKSQIEIMIREEIEELLERIVKQNGQPITPVKYLPHSTANNISSLMFGKRRKFDDPKRLMWEELTDKTRSMVGKATALSFFPLLKKLSSILNIGPQNELIEMIEQMKCVYREEIEEHRRTHDSDHVRDFIDGYLTEIEKQKDDPKSTFKIPVLEDVIDLFYGAGGEAMRVTMDWLMLTTAAFPEVQKRVRSEIDSVIGSERFPTRADYLQMPYTEAVIQEIYRWRAGLPINIPRYTFEDMEINSYFIPKHTQIVGLFWAVNRDPNLWGKDVEEFRPERFLSKDGKQVQKPEYFIPFSSGRRACPGESLANVMVFMYYTAILQKFTLEIPEGEAVNLEEAIAVGLQTNPYNLCFKIRK